MCANNILKVLMTFFVFPNISMDPLVDIVVPTHVCYYSPTCMYRDLMAVVYLNRTWTFLRHSRNVRTKKRTTRSSETSLYMFEEAWGVVVSKRTLKEPIGCAYPPGRLSLKKVMLIKTHHDLA